MEVVCVEGAEKRGNSRTLERKISLHREKLGVPIACRCFLQHEEISSDISCSWRNFFSSFRNYYVTTVLFDRSRLNCFNKNTRDTSASRDDENFPVSCGSYFMHRQSIDEDHRPDGAFQRKRGLLEKWGGSVWGYKHILTLAVNLSDCVRVGGVTEYTVAHCHG